MLGSLHRGGAETLALNVIKYPHEYGYNFFCTYRYKDGVFEKDFYDSGAKLCYLPYKNIYFFRYLFSLREFIIENKIKIVHAHQPIDAIYAMLSVIGLKVTVVQTHHGYDFEMKGIARYMLKYSLKFVKMNFFVSNTQMMYFAEKYRYSNLRQKVLYNGIDMNKFCKSKNTDGVKNIRKELAITKNKLLLVSVGNFTEVRDQLLLCKFINLLKNHITDFHFVFVGSKQLKFPQYYDRCVEYCNENKINKYVSFVQNRNDIHEILTQSDVFIYATKYDTFGIAIVEAMAEGIPVFVNDWAVMKEITLNGEYATLYETGNENELLQKFMLFLHDKKSFLMKSEMASKYVRNRFSIENHIKNLKKEYLQSVSKQ